MFLPSCALNGLFVVCGGVIVDKGMWDRYGMGGIEGMQSIMLSFICFFVCFIYILLLHKGCVLLAKYIINYII